MPDRDDASAHRICHCHNAGLERILRRTKLTLLGGITEWTALPPAELLDAEAAQQFIRCHQSYWVNFRQIETMENDCFLLSGGLRVPISRTYRSTAREQFFSRLQI
ncbi:MAG: LytTR family DNA-binding domain-containing protein [Oscillospiraceae bacterium]